ncbi:MAG: nucleoside-diphosphate sugar epimerase/dehydratase, partial [Acutalibacteraceae bacterium]|nr:nucleoside-diphosphate sugar epimerase/dehydratase [Acutalibacteraceae bacterium]
MKNIFVKKIIFVIADFIFATLSVCAAYFLNEGFTKPNNPDVFFCALGAFPAILVLMFYIFKFYSILWRYGGINDYIKLAAATSFACGILYVVQFALGLRMEFSALVYILVFAVIFLTFVRLLIRKIYMPSDKNEGGLSGNIMIIGAGYTGSLLINDIHKNSNADVKCVIDDDIAKKGQYICGVKIVGGREEIVAAAKEHKIDLIVFAIPTCMGEQKSAILKICQKTGCELRTMPSINQILSVSDMSAGMLRRVEIEDLLGRDPIKINLDSIMNYVQDKTVMVTGGGGSIGSELCRQLAVHNPKKLIIFDIYENNAYDIQNELLREHPDLDLTVLIGSVRDTDRLDSVFSQYKPEIVYHAAAHKHVPLMEDSPNESIKNNVFGTLNTVKCADKHGVEKFVLISTDKAVNPTNIMGASKRICEMIVQSYNHRSDTDFVAVRFGNVLGSNGSVIPLFKKQIEMGGPITITDPNIIRYFMTIPEAVSLVLQAGATAKGGEIFVLDMGEPVKILDLAENLIKLSGFEPYIDIKIKFIGLRPGEKLYEEKLLAEEGLIRTQNRLIHIGQPIEFDEDKFYIALDEMKKIMSDDSCDIRAIVKSVVPTYNYRATANVQK